ncbi:MAG: ABC transporter substrate-binding protein [Spirochaetales bacterium]|nr:ABC transporter substrate-binding protein [Spirochaetales bacterium]
MKKVSVLLAFVLSLSLWNHGLFARGNQDVVASPSDESLPQRIVQVGSAGFMVENALYLFPSAPERIVAMTDGNQGRGAFLADLDPEYAEKTILPRSANTEAILALSPDRVVMKNFLKKRMGLPLENLGIPVTYLDLETPEAWMSDLDNLGALMGNEERAQDIGQEISHTTSQLATALEGVEKKPRVLFLYWSVKDGSTAVNLPPKSYMQTRMVEMAGGEAVWLDAELGSRWTKTNFEQVAAWDPDVVIVAAYHVSAEEAMATLKDDSAWSSLRAFQEDQAHVMPADYYSWDQPDIRWLLGVQWMAKTFHPQRFEDVDLLDQARQFYQTMFGMTGEQFDSMILPRLTGLR